MLRYLNLDLIYNVNNYLYPLFYYNYSNYSYEVHCPITKKSLYKSNSSTFYYDYITSKFQIKNGKYGKIFDKTKYVFTENIFNLNGSIFFNKCEPFKLDSEDLYFLKNNTRIN